MVKGWGKAATPLLPTAIRANTKSMLIPANALVGTGLPYGTTYSQLDSSIWDTIEVLTDVLEDDIRSVFKNELANVLKNNIFDEEVLFNKEVVGMPLEYRTRTLISKRYHDLSSLSDVTYGELLRIKNFGKLSLLELSCVLEAYLTNSYFDDGIIHDSDLATSLRECILSVYEEGTYQVDSLLDRYGWRSEPPKTLQEIGNKYNVTRERIRQIQDKFEKRMSELNPNIPLLQSAINEIHKASPILAKDAIALLRKKNYSHTPIHPGGILNACHLFDVDCKDLLLKKVKNEQVVFTREFSVARKLILSKAKKSTSYHGAFNVEDLATRLENENIANIETPNLVNILKLSNDIVFLNREWFYNASANRNRIYNVGKKIFSIADAVKVESLRAAVRDAFRQRSIQIVPPRNVVAEMFRKNGNFTVAGDTIVIKQKYDPKKELAKIEHAYYELFKSQDYRAMRRREILDVVENDGFNEYTSSLYLSWSPIINRVAIDIYCIRGKEVTSGEVQVAIEQRGTKDKVFYSFGWTEDRMPYLTFKMNAPSIRYGLLNIPSKAERFIKPNTYQILHSTGEVVDNFNIAGDPLVMFGLRKAFTVMGVDEGDYLVVKFNTFMKTVNFEVGNRDLLDEYGI